MVHISCYKLNIRGGQAEGMKISYSGRCEWKVGMQGLRKAIAIRFPPLPSYVNESIKLSEGGGC